MIPHSPRPWCIVISLTLAGICLTLPASAQSFPTASSSFPTGGTHKLVSACLTQPAPLSILMGGTHKLVCACLTQSAPRPSLSALKTWDNGLAEMSYYQGTDQIYGQRRDYTRVHIINRQWMDQQTGVKTDAGAANAMPVFKLNMAEEIPTENYNYRYLTTVFLRRPDLEPFKMVCSSQEWCGTNFKHLRWNNDRLDMQSFSYFPNEGDKQWHESPDARPYEALFLIARDVAATGTEHKLNVLPPLRSTREVHPATPIPATLSPTPAGKITVPLGTLEAARVDVKWTGPETTFWIEKAAPFRLLKYQAGTLTGELKFTERRAYWDRAWGSGFHKPNEAP